MASKAYVAVQVTLEAKDTNYHLLSLIREIEEDCPATARELHIQSDPGNGQATVMIGDAEMGDTRYGIALAAAGCEAYRSTIQNVLVGHLYLRSDADNALVNVQVMAA